jgi:uncharacterized RDD family membrane protein YckC
VFAAKGLGWNALGWLAIHGTTEIFAICISAAAGMRIGLAIAFPGRETRTDAVVRAGRSAALAMAGTVVMLAVAGLLEGVGRQTVLDDSTRYSIGDRDADRLVPLFLPAPGPRSLMWPFGRRREKAPRSMRRSFVTPEGIDLRLELAGAGARAGAFALDFVAMILILVVATIVIGLLAIAAKAEMFGILWLVGFFVLRNFWFTLFEMGGRGATPGKRLMGLRVVARDGARLTGGAVLARNAMREIEVFLPLSFLAASPRRGSPTSF